MAKIVFWILLPIVVLAVLGWFALKLIGALFGLFGYLLIGAVLVGGGVYLYSRIKRALTSGRTANRIDAARSTYRDDKTR